jgi:hypothetical protein
MSERFDAYDDLFRAEGWRHYVADAEKEMQAMTQVVMSLNTTKDGWQRKAAKYINRYQTAKRMILNAQARVKSERQNERANREILEHEADEGRRKDD